MCLLGCVVVVVVVVVFHLFVLNVLQVVHRLSGIWRGKSWGFCVRKMGYIGAHGVAALHRYKYSGVDHSYLAKYVLQPFWTRFVTIFPLWMPWVFQSLEIMLFVWYDLSVQCDECLFTFSMVCHVMIISGLGGFYDNVFTVCYNIHIIT